jgi:hypothetical protein
VSLATVLWLPWPKFTTDQMVKIVRVIAAEVRKAKRFL